MDFFVVIVGWYIVTDIMSHEQNKIPSQKLVSQIDARENFFS